MTNKNDLELVEKAITRYKQLLKVKYARESFLLFSKYIVGYNDKPNHLIIDHAHKELCDLMQGTLKDIEDYGGYMLSGNKGRVYDTFMASHPPPTTPQISSSPLEGPLLNSSDVEKNNRPGSKVNVEDLAEGGILDESTLTVLQAPDGKVHSEGQDKLNSSSLDPEGIIKDTPEKEQEETSLNINLPPYADIRKFVLELMPRGTFKSTIGTESFPLYAWLFNPNLRIHICSETLDKALLYAGAVKNSLENNQRYREMYEVIYDVYPDAKRDKWTNSELNLTGRTSLTREPNLSCGSPDVPKVGQHYDIIIVDDLMGPTNISDTGIEKATNYYKGLLSVLEPGGILIIIGTRWHYKDVYSYILDNENDRFACLVKGAYNDDGSLFFPERLTQEFLDAQRKSQGSYFFSCQYLNRVVDEQDADFKRSQFRNEKVMLDTEDNPINVFMAVDPVPPGSEMKHDPDYFGIVVGGIDKAGALYYLDGWKGRPTVGEAIDKILQMADTWKPKILGFESVSFSKLYSFMLKDEMRKRNKYWTIKEVKRTDRRESKAQRIRRLVPYYERGDVIHRLGAGAVLDLEDQLIDFPRGSHDDLIDAWADIVDIGYKPGRNLVKNEARDESRKRVRRQYLNPITRY